MLTEQQIEAAPATLPARSWPADAKTFADRLSAAWWKANNALPMEARTAIDTRGEHIAPALYSFLDIIGDLYRAVEPAERRPHE